MANVGRLVGCAAAILVCLELASTCWGGAEKSDESAGVPVPDFGKTVTQGTAAATVCHSCSGKTKKKKRKKKKRRVSLFCAKPYEHVCKDSPVTSEIKERIAAHKREVREKVARDFDMTTLETGTLTERIAAAVKFAIKLSTHMHAASKALEKTSRETWIPKVAKHLRSAIDRRFADGEMSEDFHSELIANVDLSSNLKVVSATDLFEPGALPEAGKKQAQNYYYKKCGSDGMNNGMWAWSLGKIHYVVICPGWFAGNANDSDESSRFLSLLWAIGHELSHYADALEYPVAYEAFRRCVLEHHSDALDVDDGTRRDVEKLIASMWLDPKADFREKYKSLLEKSVMLGKSIGELSADYWGVETVANFIEASDFNEIESVERTIRESMRGLCNLVADASHPSAKHRIELALGGNPRIRKLLGCSAPRSKTAKPGCTLKGATATPLF